MHPAVVETRRGLAEEEFRTCNNVIFESNDSVFVNLISVTSSRPFSPIGLRHRFVQVHVEFLRSQRMRLIMGNQRVQGVEAYRVYEVILGLSSLLLRPNPAVVHFPLEFEMGCEN